MDENYTEILSVMLGNKCLGYEIQQNYYRAISLNSYPLPCSIYSSGSNINYQEINLSDLISNHKFDINDMIKLNEGNHHISKYLRYQNE